MAAAEGQNAEEDDSMDIPEEGQSENLLQSPAISRLGTCLSVMNQAHRGAEGLGPVPMRPTLLKMLGPLLKVQVGQSLPV